MTAQIINRVAESGLITIDLEKFLPATSPAPLDLVPFLFRGLILKEKEFREAVQQHDWSAYQDKPVAVFCSADAILPAWAFMLVASRLDGIAQDVYAGTPEEMEKYLVLKNLSTIAVTDFTDKLVVIKGCGDRQIDISAYLEITRLLRPVVKSLMYGEPCSTVPVYRKK